jgi:hypothetical protein
MKTNGYEPAHPTTITFSSEDNEKTVNRQIGSTTYEIYGLTKREQFAAMAMQGLCANEHVTALDQSYIAKFAVMHADALIEALNKESEADNE